MTPEQKAAYLLDGRGKDAALGIAQSFLVDAIRCQCETDCIYWQDVINEIDPPSYFEDL